MKTRIILVVCFSILLSAILITACKKNDRNTPIPSTGPTYLDFKIPAGWPAPATNIFANNPLSEEGFQLGKKLFYDGRLSQNGNFPCASCHQQFAAFATFDHDFSHGFNNAFTTRNAPGLYNLAWMTKMHYDGGINHIEVQPLAPITSPIEMAETITNVLAKLNADTAYPKMFKAAFGSTEINSQRMLKALSQFMGSIVSANSKYDKVQRGEATFTFSEQNGYTLFKAKCETCHKEPLFTDNSFRNTGLTINPFLNDFGRLLITHDPADSLKFKVPSLRNVALTFPYGHDGRFSFLESALDHYRTGIQTSQPTLDPLLRARIPMTNNERSDLIYFLNTLSDTTMTKNPRFAQ